MTPTQIINKIKRLGFTLQDIPNDKYHKGVDVKFLEMRGKIIDETLPKELKYFQSADHIITKDGYVIRKIDDFLGQMKTVQEYIKG